MHVWLGIQGEDLDQATARKFGIDGGALVRDVKASSPADDAGLNDRDVIIAVNGTKVQTFAGLVVALRTRKPGDTVKLDLLRDGKPLERSATLREKPAQL